MTDLNDIHVARLVASKCDRADADQTVLVTKRGWLAAEVHQILGRAHVLTAITVRDGAYHVRAAGMKEGAPFNDADVMLLVAEKCLSQCKEGDLALCTRDSDFALALIWCLRANSCMAGINPFRTPDQAYEVKILWNMRYPGEASKQ